MLSLSRVLMACQRQLTLTQNWLSEIVDESSLKHKTMCCKTFQKRRSIHCLTEFELCPPFHSISKSRSLCRQIQTKPLTCNPIPINFFASFDALEIPQQLTTMGLVATAKEHLKEWWLPFKMITINVAYHRAWIALYQLVLPIRPDFATVRSPPVHLIVPWLPTQTCSDSFPELVCT